MESHVLSSVHYYNQMNLVLFTSLPNIYHIFKRRIEHIRLNDGHEHVNHNSHSSNQYYLTINQSIDMNGQQKYLTLKKVNI